MWSTGRFEYVSFFPVNIKYNCRGVGNRREPRVRSYLDRVLVEYGDSCMRVVFVDLQPKACAEVCRDGCRDYWLRSAVVILEGYKGKGVVL